jgi:hypothetical protein
MFDDDPGIVGRELRLGGRAYTVIGVVSNGYAGTFTGVRAELFVLMMMYEEIMGVPMLDARGSHSLFGRARLAPGVTVVQAETAMAAVASA